jgi:transcriptional regulator with XRE-family HTH domain
MTETSRPPMAWRYCGNQIKLWRTQAGISREELGKEANYEPESVKSMEQGRRRPTLRLLEVADEMCQARGLLVAAAEYLQPEKFTSFRQDFMRYETEAIVINSYQNQLIPGLLQTEATARALMNAHRPPFDDATVEERVIARLERQNVLKKQTRSFSFLIEETVLRRRISDESTHQQQLHHLLEAGTPRHVTIQVVPSTGAHVGLNGPFTLLETPGHDQLAYEEGQTTAVLYSDPAKVSMLAQRHTVIVRQALDPEESARYISKLVEEL